MQSSKRPIDFVITGTPRSGTGFVSQILRNLGFDCGHEARFNPWATIYEERRHDDRPWGDSSWLAVPFLSHLPPSTKVFHVVRDPLKAINSIIGVGHFSWDSDYRTFLLRHCGIDRGKWNADPSTAQFFWMTWNRMIEQNSQVVMRFQLERIENFVQRIANEILPKSDIRQNHIKDSIGAVPTDYNTRPHQCGPILTESDLTKECRAMGRRYGYRY